MKLYFFNPFCAHWIQGIPRTFPGLAKFLHCGGHTSENKIFADVLIKFCIQRLRKHLCLKSQLNPPIIGFDKKEKGPEYCWTRPSAIEISADDIKKKSN